MKAFDESEENSSGAADEFIRRWESSAASERANYQLFLSELCDVLGVARPEPARADDSQNAYVFERAVKFQNPDGTTSDGRIDLYKRGAFVLEAKQEANASRHRKPHNLNRSLMFRRREARRGADARRARRARHSRVGRGDARGARASGAIRARPSCRRR